MNSQDYALVVGIDHYPEFGEGGRPLRGAVGDATSFHAWLTQEPEGGKVPAANCHLITSEANPLKPLKHQVDAAFLAIRRAAEKNGGRRLYFYFSGHGQSPAPEELFLCMADWSQDNRNAALKSSHYRSVAQRCMPFQESYFFLDCCRVRSVGVTGQDASTTCAGAGAPGRREFVAYATDHTDVAYEADAEPTAGPESPPVAGHFTQVLLAGLRGGAAVTGGGATPSSLKLFIEREVPSLADKNQQRQEAVVENGMPANPEPLLGTALPQARFQIACSSGRKGMIVLVHPDDREQELGDASASPFPPVSLQKGLYLIVEKSTGFQMRLPFKPEPGVTHVAF